MQLFRTALDSTTTTMRSPFIAPLASHTWPFRSITAPPYYSRRLKRTNTGTRDHFALRAQHHGRMSMTLSALDDKWGWVTEDADVSRLPQTLRRLEAASKEALSQSNPALLLREIAYLSAEGAIRG